jgi:hypothetical protein
MSAFLDTEDVQRITGCVRYTAQRRKLAKLGIAYIVAANGEPLVRPEALDAKPRTERNIGPRWDRWNETAKPA